jgi:hypothetical protein
MLAIDNFIRHGQISGGKPGETTALQHAEWFEDMLVDVIRIRATARLFDQQSN